MPTIVFATGQTVRLTGHQNPWWLLLYALIIVVALALLRLVWVWASMKLAFSGVRAHNGLSTSSYRRLVIAMSLAGVRGAITLAGVLTLPLKMIDGTPFPGRDLAIILAAGVIVLSLILATVALPHALRNLELPTEADTENDNAADEKRLRSAAAEAAIRAIESAPHATTDADEAGLYADTSTRIVTMYRLRIDGYKDSEGILMAQEKADHIERQLRLVGLHAERDEILGVGQNLGIKEMTLRKIEQEIDLQEARYSS
jgi:CPA1 family monovalent cation:H+ antiporter